MAQAEPPALLTQWLQMVSSGNWSQADTLLAVDYEPLYPHEDTLPGREAWKQRQASNTLFDMFESIQFDLVSYAVAGDTILYLAEMKVQSFGPDQEIAAPYIGALVTSEDLILKGHSALDQDLIFEQL
jgi:hypothetical protein